ncbi:hypothetical protein GCM10010218_34570 [Streptomyces mashuensis]|uniref:Uncharacterized protein n=1 Tax=Streptomyces mashuensis TaxID=33904 RepID=A0A919EDN2_9ACTN|nr:hypothetical protein GCM10010218_34570 [Streptomyces mashuensis]
MAAAGAEPGALRAGSRCDCGSAVRSLPAAGGVIGRAALIRSGVQWRNTAAGSCEASPDALCCTAVEAVFASIGPGVAACAVTAGTLSAHISAPAAATAVVKRVVTPFPPLPAVLLGCER